MYVTIFTTNTARTINDPANIAEMTSWPNVVCEPDYSAVKGIPPQFWKLEEGRIVPMLPIEVRYRKRIIERMGMDNSIRRLNMDEISPPFKDYEAIQLLENEYFALRTVNYVYLGLLLFNVVINIALYLKK